MLAAGAAAEIGARQQNRRAFVPREIQDELGIGLFAGKITPIVEEYAAEAFARERLQKLFRYHLVGVDVDAVERHHHAGVG